MTTFEALVLGVVQGVTEFLPISSTAHLRIVPALAGWADPGAAYTAVLQLGTLAAVVGYFLPDLLRMLRAALAAIADRSRPPEPAARQLGYIILGTVPVGVAGIAFKHAIEGSLRSLWVISVALIVVALALAFVERSARHSRDYDDIRLRDALIIGCAQALALVPGVSRSGITLVAALAIGLRRDAAARFSFLLGVPAIAAAGIFELKPLLKAHDTNVSALVVGLLAAAGAGYISIAWLLRFLRARTRGRSSSTGSRSGRAAAGAAVHAPPRAVTGP
jgi:undecaprenyl-diphosphatase